MPEVKYKNQFHFKTSLIAIMYLEAVGEMTIVLYLSLALIVTQETGYLSQRVA